MEFKKITQKDLDEIIEKHKLWLEDHECGEKAVLSLCDLSFLDLSNVNLHGADLRSANLHGVYFCCADLYGANLSNANLRGADLREADLRYADLCGADLCNADISNANFRGAGLYNAYLCNADLRGVNFYGVNFRGADLCNTILCDADLRDADLRGADLCGANLRGANFHGANLCNADLNDVLYDEYTAFFALQCCEEGSFIGYKEASGKIVKLRITENAKRSSATSRKCRCSEAEVLDILNPDRSPAKKREVSSDFKEDFIYKVGEIVNVDDFDEDRWKECSTGIHFFMTFDEAVQYKNN